jgi:ORF6N domain.
MSDIVPQEIIENRIFLLRGKKVMIDHDLAALYGVPTKALNQAVKRNDKRFPEDFMFQLEKAEKDELVTICDRFTKLKHSSVNPYAFTENGVAMLSSVLNSEAAVMVNIQIMRAFVKLRKVISENKDLQKVIQHIERRLDVHDRQIQVAFAALKSFLQSPEVLPQKHYSPDDEKKMGFGKGKRNGNKG